MGRATEVAQLPRASEVATLKGALVLPKGMLARLNAPRSVNDDSSSDDEASRSLGSSDAEAWFMAALVSDGASDAAPAARLRIPDTILFKGGAPVCWLFCDREGRLKRKHAKRLNWDTIRRGMQKAGKQWRARGTAAANGANAKGANDAAANADDDSATTDGDESDGSGAGTDTHSRDARRRGRPPSDRRDERRDERLDKASERLDTSSERASACGDGRSVASTPSPRLPKRAPSPFAAVLRWRSQDGSGLIASTLLEWRDVRDLERARPVHAAPALVSRGQMVALQPYVRSSKGLASGVFLHRLGAEPLQNVVGWPTTGETRELMAWPPEPPRRCASKNREDSAVSSLKVDGALHNAVAALAHVAEKRVLHATATNVGAKLSLDPVEYRAFIGEFVFDSHGRPLLTFAQRVSTAVAPLKQRVRSRTALADATVASPNGLGRDVVAGLANWDDSSNLSKLIRFVDAATSREGSATRRNVSPGDTPPVNAPPTNAPQAAAAPRRPRRPDASKRRRPAPHPYGLDTAHRAHRLLRSSLRHLSDGQALRPPGDKWDNALAG
ncbi:hypothetical protein M885DRAFT_523751 [Pelagophyceae sp. CCMP2097]|nr:hypothetical protein M885DRAFT_523751 [Pelagophyceae sp. CCMP2097]|mmetsp:Transcript_30313/g.102264  ORF Transcript_30313/g.102264 Transcript_30313/m.102264 type:complete len:558 (-) Transcript_30313:172-1845(-)